MRELETTITQKGQVTIPAEIRARLGLKPRDKVRFSVEGDIVRLEAAPSKIGRWYGSVSPTKRPEDFRAVREAFEEGVAEEVMAEDQPQR